MKKLSKNKSLFILITLCLFTVSLVLFVSLAITKDREGAYGSPETEAPPFVGCEEKLSTNGDSIIEIQMRSHWDQLGYPTPLDKEMINKGFLEINKRLDRYKNSLSYINKGTPIRFVFDGFAYITANTVNQKNLIEGLNLLKEPNSTKSFIDSSKVCIKELSFPHDKTVDTKFIGENAVSDIPTCTYLTIEWAAFATSNCINNMPNLSYIYIYNHNDGFSNTELCSAIKNVKPYCTCEVRLDRPNKLYRYVPATYDNNAQITSYAWTGDTQDIAYEPEDVKYSVSVNVDTQGLRTGHIHIVGKKNSTDFGFNTLRGAFEKLNYSNDRSSVFWEDFAKNDNIELTIETYGGYISNSISEDGLNAAIKEYLPPNTNKQFKLTKISLISAAECQIYFRGPACIHHCPHLTSIEMERPNFQEGSAPAIIACENLSYIKVSNRSDNLDPPSDINAWIQGVQNNCEMFVKCWWPWKDGHWKYTLKNTQNNTGEWS